MNLEQDFPETLVAQFVVSGPVCLTSADINKSSVLL